MGDTTTHTDDGLHTGPKHVLVLLLIVILLCSWLYVHVYIYTYTYTRALYFSTSNFSCNRQLKLEMVIVDQHGHTSTHFTLICLRCSGCPGKRKILFTLNDWGLKIFVEERIFFFVWYWESVDRGGTVLKVLCYKPEGRWFDPSWCQLIFHWHKILLITLWLLGRLSL